MKCLSLIFILIVSLTSSLYAQRSAAFARANNRQERENRDKEQEFKESLGKSAKDNAKFVISDIIYNIKKSVIGGNTDTEFLAHKLGIVKDYYFEDEESLRKYIEGRQKYLQTFKTYVHGATVSYEVMSEYVGTVQKVKIIITAKEGLNFIALPSFKYDTNNGVFVGLRFRQYNFLGKHETFNFGTTYNYDENGNNAVFAAMGGSVPFVTNGQEWEIRFGGYGGYFGSTLDDSDPDDMDQNVFTAKVGFDTYWPIYKSTYQIRTAFLQEINVSAYPFYGNDAVRGDKDDYYLKTSAAISFPVPIKRLPYIGLIEYNYSFGANVSYRLDKAIIPESRGLFWNTGTGFRFTNYKDAYLNFKKGYELGLLVGIGFNPYKARTYGADGSNRTGVDQYAWRVAPVINLKLAYPFNKHVEIKSRFQYQYSIFRDDPRNNNLGNRVRGIYDERISGDMLISTNFDLVFNMYLGGISKLGELHMALFYDMAVARTFSTKNWQEAFHGIGLEFIIYPSFSRNLNLRISYGLDAVELFKNGSLAGNTERDEFPTSEFFVGFQMFYE